MNADQPRTARSYGYDSSYSSFQSSDLRIFGYDVLVNSFGTIKLEALSGNVAGFGWFTGKERDSESGLDYFAPDTTAQLCSALSAKIRSALRGE